MPRHTIDFPWEPSKPLIMGKDTLRPYVKDTGQLAIVE